MTTMHPWPNGDQVPDGSITGRVIVYERTATDDGLSLQRQEAAVRDYLAKHPQWNFVGVYRDAGSSAHRRPGLQQMLAAARAGQFDAVVVYRVDRLARRIEDLDTIVHTLHDASVTLHSATEPLDTSTPQGRLIATLIGVFAEYVRAQPDEFVPMKRRLRRYRTCERNRHSDN